ncbi:DUF2281 domain-containing protein [cf. Phormidesmis sp. LEGE 11477]|uniref:DUF2281 domain-containing protein n=1 Tax=cf. Phormidesmis sp. LEGE 11477 TaxID=1828680 RepID=UPI0018806346|nr:DUF2281 domain-containing protein [cf. Phormidesmis sp. LEGE 11477]MBE9063085.1 DUF2281 domain-containing protein [cf. Phormidesmis sp. LEGE 11477]
MTLKELLIQEIDSLPDSLTAEVLNFLRTLKTKQAQKSSSTKDATASQTESLDYPLQGKEPYRYDDPFSPAVPLEDWDVLQ